MRDQQVHKYNRTAGYTQWRSIHAWCCLRSAKLPGQHPNHFWERMAKHTCLVCLVLPATSPGQHRHQFYLTQSTAGLVLPRASFSPLLSANPNIARRVFCGMYLRALCTTPVILFLSMLLFFYNLRLQSELFCTPGTCSVTDRLDCPGIGEVSDVAPFET